MADRIACCVPFCGRTCRGDPIRHEWVCGAHWRSVSAVLRRRKARLFRRARHLYGDNGYWAFPAGSPRRMAAVKMERVCRMAWQRCKKQAIERAAGI